MKYYWSCIYYQFSFSSPICGKMIASFHLILEIYILGQKTKKMFCLFNIFLLRQNTILLASLPFANNFEKIGTNCCLFPNRKPKYTQLNFNSVIIQMHTYIFFRYSKRCCPVFAIIRPNVSIQFGQSNLGSNEITRKTKTSKVLSINNVTIVC